MTAWVALLTSGCEQESALSVCPDPVAAEAAPVDTGEVGTVDAPVAPTLDGSGVPAATPISTVGAYIVSTLWCQPEPTRGFASGSTVPDTSTTCCSSSSLASTAPERTAPTQTWSTGNCSVTSRDRAASPFRSSATRRQTGPSSRGGLAPEEASGQSGSVDDAGAGGRSSAPWSFSQYGLLP